MPKVRQPRFERMLDCGDRLGRTQIGSTVAARPGKEMQVRVDKAGQNCMSRTGQCLCFLRDKRSELLLSTNGKDRPASNSNRFRPRPGWIEGEGGSTVEEKICSARK